LFLLEIAQLDLKEKYFRFNKS